MMQFFFKTRGYRNFLLLIVAIVGAFFISLVSMTAISDSKLRLQSFEAQLVEIISDWHRLLHNTYRLTFNEVPPELSWQEGIKSFEDFKKSLVTFKRKNLEADFLEQDLRLELVHLVDGLEYGNQLIAEPYQLLREFIDYNKSLPDKRILDNSMHDIQRRIGGFDYETTHMLLIDRMHQSIRELGYSYATPLEKKQDKIQKLVISDLDNLTRRYDMFRMTLIGFVWIMISLFLWRLFILYHNLQISEGKYKNTIDSLTQTEKRLDFLATHDPLTGLPNRRLLEDRIEQAVAFSSRLGQSLVIMLVDVDDFKHVNDTLGHSSGDELLKQISKRILGMLRKTDTLARFGGDEFVIVMQTHPDISGFDFVAEKILTEISRPFDISGRELYINVSLGLSLFPEDGRDTETLVKNADTALYFAKSLGKKTFRFFSQDMNDQIQQRIDLAAGIRKALIEKEFELYYQPKVNLKTETVSGMEALIRWRHPEKGLVYPGSFISIAESFGLIQEIGIWVIETVGKHIRLWKDAKLDPGKVSINLSAAQFGGEDIIDAVRTTMSQNGLDGSCLEIEVTESMVMQNAEHAILTFLKLREMGLSIAIDDFGTGHSSLSYIKRFPMDCLKIDKSFVDDIEIDPSDDQIVQTIILMAHTLKLRVVAEGVENIEQLNFLKRHQCDEVQGYYYSKPLPVSEMTNYLKIVQE
jgi:diguanylate cyclase (GGDEF)-like protein